MANPRAIVFSSSIVLFCVTVLASARLTYGDLQTANVFSLEWLVDSSDEIHLVQIVPLDANGQLAVKPLRALKTHRERLRLGTPSADLASTLQGYVETRRWKGRPSEMRPSENEEWILFMRGKYTGSFIWSRNVFYGINLTQPLKSYMTAAIPREGKPLADRDTIVGAVEARVQLNRQLPPLADREATEKLRLGGDLWSPMMQSSRAEGQSSTWLKAHLGGTLVRIDCDYWDTWLDWALVPVEPEDHVQLLEAARQEADSTQRSKFRNPILALVNFPGEETQACLQDIRAGRPSHTARMSAGLVLHFFIYHLEPTDPLNQKLLGRWRLEGLNEIIDLTFTRDQTFVATAFSRPREKHEESQHLWDGQGYWIVRDGELSITRTHAREGLSWRIGPQRELFRSKKIERVTPTEVVLHGGPPMKRR